MKFIILQREPSSGFATKYTKKGSDTIDNRTTEIKYVYVSGTSGTSVLVIVQPTLSVIVWPMMTFEEVPE